MRQFLYLSVLTISLLGIGNLQAQAAAEQTGIVTSRDQFSIPFRFDQQELTRLNAQKVHLFLSRDHGQTWKLVETTGLDQSQFMFKPESDGDYWFSVAVSDADQVMHPEPSLNQPGLKIVVDRTRAKMDLNVRLRSGRQLELNWKVSDKHPVIQSLELEFRNSVDDPWNRVYVKKQLSGKTAWKIQAGQYPEIRGRFTDAAGNVTEKKVKLMPASQQQPIVLAANAHQSQSRSWPSAGAAIQLSSDSHGSDIQPQTAQPATDPTRQAESELKPIREQVSSEQPEHSTPHRAAFEETPFRSQVSQTAYRNLETVRYMNAHQFDIEYQVAGTGPSGVGVVELFVTQDNGAQWWRYGIDADLQSPMTVKVPEDGRYGFHFRIHSGVGNAEPPPQPGQKPQIDLIVDSNKPQVRLLDSYQGHGDNINQVTVQWSFSDNHPIEKPIFLFYSSSRLGPWEQTEGALKNTGTSTFMLPRNTPAKLYVKVVARDAAGNQAEAISEKPLLIDLARPTARVITIEPVSLTE